MGIIVTYMEINEAECSTCFCIIRYFNQIAAVGYNALLTDVFADLSSICLLGSANSIT